MKSKYASPERAEDKVIKMQSHWFRENNLLTGILDAVADVIFILNEHRQIVYANSSVNKRFKNIRIEDVLGQRPGEVLNCEYAFKEPGGCGTSEFCRTCGAVNAVLVSIKGIKNEQECRIIQRDNNQSLDLRVYANPVTVNGNNFTVFTLADISDEKRRQILEKLFFHDILNSVGGLKNLVALLKDEIFEEKEEALKLLEDTTSHIIEEITVQKELTSAETDNLITATTSFTTLNLLNEVLHFFKNHESGKNKILTLKASSSDNQIISDKRLLRRVIVNLIKNALEASKENEEIIAGCQLVGNIIYFTVWNSCFIPKDIQNQIFQRSFSTKGRGRGIGTYSIKLLTEKYLGGKVAFSSTKEKGTTFTLIIPVNQKNT